ncbi:uncharacterized protein K452DRAFT_294343 [Aplosporella prunicola CBS 121167]|uniref:Uncharacterized protein n=1 Tax=Aplosporella prunicola CBS 121167 TaxID=1176127 RepID=A0A6A6BRU0_9PEZI|nr:uncharacterized protein K452DRAFT_294343 [Aplosporella prunicola CBS 121167]KAF2146809.1 hypothetical protein K452DRAFT_294343 [Aplosporella prunicola CBS 121167]
MNVPTVTEEDLRAFQRKHFPTAPAPASFVPVQDEAEEYTYEEDWEYYEEDDGLGYYSDGVKRTLTDEQIAMFRHSEIQATLKERRRQAEDDVIEEGTGAVPLNGTGEATPVNVRAPSATPSDTPNFGGSPPPTPKAKSKNKRRNKKRKRNTEDPSNPEEDEGITYRRIARELDEQKNVAVELDY